MGIVKTRMAAKRLCDSGMVRVNGQPVKPSREILVGEGIDLFFPQKEMRLKVLGIPPGKSVAKGERPAYCLVESLKEL
jgi:ribosomal 50S subunit-recycling heat shock protein